MVLNAVKLNDICVIDWGNTNLTKKSYVENGKYLAVSATGADGTIDYYEHEPNVCVLSAIGEQCGKIFFPQQRFTAIKNTITLTPKRDQVNSKYLYYLFKHIKLPKRGSAQPFISKGDIQSFQIEHLPTLAEQQRISSVLGALDDKIENNRRMNKTLEEIAWAIFKSWFVNFDPVTAKIATLKSGGSNEDVETAAMCVIASKSEGKLADLKQNNSNAYKQLAQTVALFPTSFGEDGLPTGWESGALSNLISIQNGFAFKSKDWDVSGVPVVKIGSVKPATVDLGQVSFVSSSVAERKKAFQSVCGDVLVGLTGYVGEVGRIPPTPNSPLVNQRVGRVIFKDKFFSPFVYSLMRASEFKDFAKNQAHGSAQQNVSTRQLVSYSICIANRAIISRYNFLCSSIYERIQLNFAENQTLAELRDTLLPKLISAELNFDDSHGGNV